MLHPQSEHALALWAAGPQVTDPGFGVAGIAALRHQARAAAAAEPREPVHRIEDVDADGVPCRLLVPTAATAHPVVVFLHGGGFVFGDLDTHDAQARRLANRTGFAVLAVDYRRPPEHRFPAAPTDVDTALRWLVANGAGHGLDVGRTVLLGDSAGGNLALVAALRRPELPAALVLVYPFLDPQLGGASYARGDVGGLTPEEARWYWEQYAGSPADLHDPDLAPLLADAARFAAVGAPVLLQVAGNDPLLDEGLLLAQRLRAAGTELSVTTYGGMVHGFWRHPALFDAAEEALAEIADFLRHRV